MKNTKCPERKFCFSYKDNACEGCAVGDEITKLHKRIDRLKKQNKTLTIQRNAWALTAKALTPEWISVEDRLPEPNKLVLCLWKRLDDESHYGFATYQEHGSWYVSNEGMPIVSHWMPLPEPPKGE